MSEDTAAQAGERDGVPGHDTADGGDKESPPGGRLPHSGGTGVERGAPRRTVGFLRRVEEVFFSVVLLLMVVVGLLPMLARLGVPVSASWAEPLVRQMVLWLALFGAAAATADSKHISIDAVTHLLPRSLSTAIRMLTCLVAGGVSGVLAWVSVAFVRGEAEYATAGSGIFGAPEWCWQLVLPVGFSLLSLSLVVAAWRHFRSLVTSPAEGRVP